MLNTEILYAPHNILRPEETKQNRNQKIFTQLILFRSCLLFAISSLTISVFYRLAQSSQRPRNQSSIPRKAVHLSHLQNVQAGYGAHSASLSIGTGVSFPGGRAVGA